MSVSTVFNNELNKASQVANVFIDNEKNRAKVVIKKNKEDSLKEETIEELEKKIARIKEYLTSKGIIKDELIVETRGGRYYSSTKGFLD